MKLWMTKFPAKADVNAFLMILSFYLRKIVGTKVLEDNNYYR